MKLDWKRGQYASIVDCGKYTASTWRDPACGGWNFSVYGNAGAVVLKKIADTCGSMEGAEKLAESWIEQNDRPEWHDVTDWLSWAEWRGWKLCARISTLGLNQFIWAATCEAPLGDCGSCIGIEHAKSAAEKWVREQGEMYDQW